MTDTGTGTAQWQDELRFGVRWSCPSLALWVAFGTVYLLQLLTHVMQCRVMNAEIVYVYLVAYMSP
jgi:hypothetical protein